jgi:MFS family permease
MIVGFSLAAIGMLLIGFGAHGITPYLWLAVAAAVMGLGNGIAAPATSNATISFAPGEVASIAGLRGMFRQLGSIVAISVTTAIVARSATPGVQLGHSFMVFGLVVIVVVIPLVFTVPNHRGTW